MVQPREIELKMTDIRENLEPQKLISLRYVLPAEKNERLKNEKGHENPSLPWIVLHFL